jgi:hypothetical protein
MPTTLVESLTRESLVLMHSSEEVLRPDESVFSSNTKTAYSIDLPAGITCQPTPICSRICYAARPGAPHRWKVEVRLKQFRLLRYLKTTPTEVVAARIVREYQRLHMGFVRWLGTGDLIPEVVRIINVIALHYPLVVQWVSSRRPALAVHLSRTSQSLFVGFSLDSSPDSLRRREVMLKAHHPRIFFTFLRRWWDEHTLGAKVIYNAKHLSRFLPFDDPLSVCPADARVVPLGRACVFCRRCFTPAVLRTE